MIFRSIREDDLDQVMKLIKTSGPGLTSLPKDRKLMSDKIKSACDLFNSSTAKSTGTYLFVLEDQQKKIVGISGIIPQLASTEDYYFHQKVEDTLQVLKIKHGPSEVCSLYLHPDQRSSGVGKLLSLARFMFIHAHPERFEGQIIAELRGMVDDNGHSPFWEEVGKKYAKMDFTKADHVLGLSTDFVPQYLTYDQVNINTLSKEAQNVIGLVHPQTAKAKALLEREGMKQDDKYGILEPGPVLIATTKQLRVFKESALITQVEIKDKVNSNALLSNFPYKSAVKDFKACLCEKDQDKIFLSSHTYKAMNISAQDKLSFYPLK